MQATRREAVEARAHCSTPVWGARSSNRSAARGRTLLDERNRWLRNSDPAAANARTCSPQTARSAASGSTFPRTPPRTRPAVPVDLTWVVANADRRLPLLDTAGTDRCRCMRAATLPECRRVLGGGGFLLIAVPATDDLIELREEVRAMRLNATACPAVVDGARRCSTCRTWTILCRQRLDLNRDHCSNCSGEPIAVSASASRRMLRRSTTSR